MQIDIRNSKSGAAFVAEIEGSLIIEEAAGTTAFQMCGSGSGAAFYHDVYLPSNRFAVEVKPTGVSL